MNFHELIKKRYSVRSYESRPVEENKLEKILEAARFAPTAANFQAFRLIVIKTEHNKQGLRRIYDRDWFVQAPVVICACGIPSKNWVRKDGKNYNDVDVAIVMDHLILAATEEGLGTCWIGAFDPKAAREVLALPKELEPVAFTPIGYPNDQPHDKKRKHITEIVSYMD